MPKYLYYGSYSAEGYKGLMAEGGTKRAEAVRKALKGIGGSVEAFYFSLGENDFYVIIDLPDNVSVTAFSLAGNMSGSFNMKTVALLSPAEVDLAIKKAVDYRPPGQK